LLVLVSGLLLAVEPATISSGIAEVSIVVMSKASNMGLVQDVPVAVVHNDAVSDVLQAPAQTQIEVESTFDAVTKAHDDDTVKVSHSALVDTPLVSTQDHNPEELQASTEQLDIDQLAEPETLREEEFQGGNMVDEDEVTQLEAPEEVISSASFSAFEETDRATVESVQVEADEDSSPLNQNKNTELEAEIPLVPEVVEIEMDSTSVTPISSQVNQLNKCSPYSIMSGYPVSSKLDEEHDDSSSLVTLMGKCLPNSIIPAHSATCKLNDVFNAAVDDEVLME
jgi:hypothetical protein